MRRIAEAGGTTQELMAISGHRTLAMIEHYTRDADKKRLADAGMAKLREQTRTSMPQTPPDSLHKQREKRRKIKGP